MALRPVGPDDCRGAAPADQVANLSLSLRDRTENGLTEAASGRRRLDIAQSQPVGASRVNSSATVICTSREPFRRANSRSNGPERSGEHPKAVRHDWRALANTLLTTHRPLFALFRRGRADVMGWPIPSPAGCLCAPFVPPRGILASSISLTNCVILLVGATGFEPATPCAQERGLATSRDVMRTTTELKCLSRSNLTQVIARYRAHPSSSRSPLEIARLRR
jgi:hypothetical protein